VDIAVFKGRAHARSLKAAEKWPMDTHDKVVVRLELDSGLLDQVESFRRSQSVIPPRTDAVRQLLQLGIASAMAGQHAAA
jgi:hypothetical protein